MSHETDPKPTPPDPTGRQPKSEPELPPPAGPGSEEIAYELPDLSNLGNLDSNFDMPHPLKGGDSASDFSWELPAPAFDSAHGERGMGMSQEELESLTGRSDRSGTDPASSDYIPPSADPASSDHLAAGADPASSDYIPGVGPISSADLIPGVEPASAEGFVAGLDPASAEFIPGVEPVSDEQIIPMAEVPYAEGEPIPPVPADVPFVVDDPDAEMVGNLEPLDPVVPGSGWFDPPAPEGAAEAEESGLSAGRARERGNELGEDFGSAVDAEPVPPADYVEGSDIFSSGPAPRAAPEGQSDVIAATALDRPPAGEGSDLPDGPTSSGNASDVALSFDRPPGGSTIHDPSASGDLPVAEEVAEVADSLFEGDETPGVFDSARLADAPDLPSTHDDHEEAELGSEPEIGHDASSILAELDPGPRPAGAMDSSSIRLEAPGMEKTIPIEPLPDDADAPFDLTASDEPLPGDFHALRNVPTEHDIDTGRPEPGGSDVLTSGSTPTSPEVYIPEDEEYINPFNDPSAIDQPSLANAPSSIFSGGGDVPPTGGSDVPVSNPDAVEFTDHPDVDLAESSSLHEIEPPVRPARRDPDGEDSGMIDWSSDHGDSSAIGVATPASGIARGPDPENPTDDMPIAGVAPPQPGKKRPSAKAPPAKDGTDPSVVVDWVAESGEKPPLRTAARDRASDDRDRDPTRTRPAPSGAGRTLVGLALGVAIGLGGAAAAYFSGVVPNSEAAKSPGAGTGANTNAGGTPTTPAAPTLADAQAALAGGDPARALEMIRPDAAANPDTRTVRGEAGLLTALREASADSPFVAANDPRLAEARADLTTAIQEYDSAKSPEGERGAVRATLRLGLTHEVAGDRTAAQKLYEEGRQKYPKYAEMFQAALDRLAATAAADGKTSRLTPAEAEQLALAVVLLAGLDQAPQPPAQPAAEEPAEAGTLYWKAVNLAAAGKYAEAGDQITRAKAAHQKRARALAGRGLNPLSDPLEQIFPRCCDDLKAYWELKQSIYQHPGLKDVVAKEGVAKALDQLLTAEKRTADLKTANDTLRAEVKTATDKVNSLDGDLRAEKANVVTLEKSIKAEKDKVTALDKDLKAEKDKVAKLDADLKAGKDTLLAAQKEVDVLKQMVSTLEKSRTADQKVVADVARELQGGKLLPEKYDAAALVAATRSAVSRATGPDLTKLIPPDLSAVVGTGLTTGHILQLADRVNKFEAAAKAAETKLTQATADHKKELDKIMTDAAADVKKLKDTYAADVKKLTTDHEAEVKKLKDTYAADVKKLNDSQGDEIMKLKDANALAVEKLKDGYAAEMKKLADKYTADTKKLTEAYDAKVKALEAEVLVERDRTAAAIKKAQLDLANAYTPAQALDMWLPVLTSLRRPADADPALDAAGKVLKAYPADSEDAAKAMTVTGVALLLKGDAAGARQMLTQARRSPAYKLAGNADWVKALDVGLASIDDPTAPLRRPVEGPRRDSAAAARFLDQGIKAYRAGRYAEAEKSLAAAAWHDESDPVVWYFLGASRWAAGKTDSATEAFTQGGEREKARLVPARVIDAAISPIQGTARDAINRIRP